MQKNELLILTGRALYGERWQTELARELGLADGRRVRQWLSGDRPVPDGIWCELSDLLEKRRVVLNDALASLSSYIGEAG